MLKENKNKTIMRMKNIIKVKTKIKLRIMKDFY